MANPTAKLTRSGAVCLFGIGAVVFLLIYLPYTTAANEPRVRGLPADVPFKEHLQRKLYQRHGLPSNWIYDMVQTRDGYIWIATHNGVARYDGLRFTVFNRANTPQLPANDTRALYETKDGSLWIGTIGGLARYRTGRPGVFERFPEFDGNSVHAIFEDDSGKLWLGTREETWAKDSPPGSRFEIIERMPDRVKAFCQDKESRLWLGADSGVYVHGGMLERLSHHRLPVSDESTGQIPPAGVNVLLPDDEGGVWIGANRGMLYVRDGRFQSRGEEIRTQQVYDIYQTHDGHLYAATRRGLYRSVDGGEFAKLPSEEFTQCIMEDREGGLWVGHSANRGLHHFRRGIARTELDDQRINCVYEDSAGGVWFGSTSGLHHMRNGEIEDFGVAEGLPHAFVATIAKSSGKTFWVGTRKGLVKWTGTELTAVHTPQSVARFNVTSAFEDSSGTLWLALASRGGCTLAAGQIQRLEGLDHGKLRWFYEDSVGQIWIGHEFGLYQHQDGELVRVRDPALDRLNSAHFIYHYVARDGTLWMGTSGGIVQVRSGRFASFTTQDGLAADYIDRLVEDSHGNLWMGGRDGIFYVSIKELNQVADGHRQKFTSHQVEQFDGVFVSNYTPKGCLDSDGKTWLAASRGVICVPPTPWPANLIPPTAQIEQVMLDGATITANGHFEFLSGRHRIAFQFAAPTFANTINAKVRYRLDGYDQDWTPAANDRVAYYTDLRPGDYAFRIAAHNGNGQWHEADESVAFNVQPRWWETIWFRVVTAVAVLVMAASWGFVYNAGVRRNNVQLRREVEQRKRTAETLEDNQRQLRNLSGRLISAQEDEKRRLARELHDDLSQRLAALAIDADALEAQLGTESASASRVQELRTRIVSLSMDIHQISRNLHPAIINDLGLVEALRVECESLSDRENIPIDYQHGDMPSSLRAGVALCVYRIAQESLRNAIKHARSDILKVSLLTEASQVALTVADEGIGIDLENARQTVGLGLQSMEERVRLVGGTLSIHSRPDQGTQIVLRIPLKEHVS